MHRIQFIRSIITLLLILEISGCASTTSNNRRSPAWNEDDRKHIPKPEGNSEDQIWDIIDHYFFYEIGKALDIGWTMRKIGYELGIVGKKEAVNLNSVDDTPNSSWFTHRHGMKRLTTDELIRGPDMTDGPEASGAITIIKGKFEGGSLGFIIIDSRGDKYVLKFDGPGWYEMASAAEVITTKFFYAAGYNVPENHIFYFHASQLIIGPKVMVPTPDGRKRKMTREDLAEMLNSQSKRKDGKIRSVASKWLSGVPVGPFHFHGRRKDDPNDRVEHDDRRELRGLRVLSSWLGDTDRRMANTLDMYVTDENDKSYIKHYLIDMGSTLGSNWGRPHPPKYGNEYALDLVNISKAFLMAGYYEDPWDYTDSMHYESIGWFESEVFDPEKWVAVYPNPASENMTYRDAYWGSKIVMAFTDEDIEAIVKTGNLSDLKAERYLIETLIKRRNKIVSYWFSKVNPLDEFHVENSGSDGYIFRFTDMALRAGVVEPDGNKYTVRVTNLRDNTVSKIKLADDNSFLLPSTRKSNGTLPDFEIEIRTQRGTQDLFSKAVGINIVYREKRKEYEVISIRRES